MSILPYNESLSNYFVSPFAAKFVNTKSEKQGVIDSDIEIKNLIDRADNIIDNVENTSTIGIKYSPKIEDSVSLPSIVIQSYSSSRDYRRRTISMELKKTLPLLDTLRIRGNNPNSVTTIVAIKKNLKPIWNLITSEDDAIALLLSTIDKLMSGDFWKEFNGELIDLIQSIIEKYINTNIDPSIDEVTRLISLSNKDILPQV